METSERTKFVVHIKTNAKKEKVAFDSGDDCLIVHVKAKPVHGRANKALTTAIEKATGRSCALVKGFTSKKKLVEIEGEREDILRCITS